MKQGKLIRRAVSAALAGCMMFTFSAPALAESTDALMQLSMTRRSAVSVLDAENGDIVNYGITVTHGKKAIPVTSANCDNILGDSSDSTLSYDPAAKKLTSNGTIYGLLSINAPGVDVELNGKYFALQDSGLNGILTIENAHNVKVSSDKYAAIFARDDTSTINCTGKVDIRSGGDVVVNGNLSIYALPHKQCALKRGHGFFLFLLGCFCVYIHCGGNIRMTHDFLNDLQVGFVLAEASAERVPQDMAAKLWQKNRVTIFFLRLGFFFLIIVCTNRADSAVDGIGEINLSIASAENKAGVSINFIGAETDDFLILIFFQKGIKHFIKHRDNADASFRFGRVYMVGASAIFLHTINKIVVDS